MFLYIFSTQTLAKERHPHPCIAVLKMFKEQLPAPLRCFIIISSVFSLVVEIRHIPYINKI